MDLQDAEFLPIFASDMLSGHDQMDLYPVYLADLEVQIEEKEHSNYIISEKNRNDNSESVVNGFISRLEMEQISIMPDAINTIRAIAEEAISRKDLNINDEIEVEEYIKKLYFEAEFILMTKSENTKSFSLEDAEAISKHFGYDVLNTITDSKAPKIIVEESKEVSDFTDEQKDVAAELASMLKKHLDNQNNDLVSPDVDELSTDTDVTTGNENVIEEPSETKSEENIEEYKQAGVLIYFRLKIKSFKGDLATLDKDLTQARRYVAHKKTLIETANKNSEALYTENVSLKEIDSDKKMLETVGFVTEIEQVSAETNAVIDYLYESETLLQSFGNAISYVYDFEKMNKMNDALEGEAFKHIEDFEFYNAPAKKLKYTKSGIIKLPFLGGDRITVIFTDTRILIVKGFSRYVNIQTISRSEIDSVTSVFEKKALSTNYGQIQAKMNTGDVAVFVLAHKNYRTKEKDEFDKRVPILEALIR